MLHVIDDNEKYPKFVVVAQFVDSLINIIWMEGVKSDAEVKGTSRTADNKVGFNIGKGPWDSSDFLEQVVARLLPVHLNGCHANDFVLGGVASYHSRELE